VVTKDRARLIWVDHARGVGIFLVVLGHTLRGLHSSGIILGGSVFRSIDTWIYAFHMPLFFLLSGLFAGRRGGRSVGTFLRDVFGSIAYPYLVWSVLQAVIQLAMNRYTNHKANLSELAGILVYPIMQFWFLYTLLLLHIGNYVLHRLGLVALGAFGVFTAFWSTQGRLDLGGWEPIETARIYGIYFAFGLLSTRYGWTERVGRAPSAALALVSALGFGAVAAAVVRPSGDGFNFVSYLAIALCGIAASVALAILLSRCRGMDFVRVIGVHSLEIYVAHTIASAGVRIVLVKGLSIHNIVAHVASGTFGGIVLPLLLSQFCRSYHADFLFRLPARPGEPEIRRADIDTAQRRSAVAD
jgi:fucose 4-O-acetylase-like acetyltransferase